MERNEPINIDTIYNRVMEILEKSAQEREKSAKEREKYAQEREQERLKREQERLEWEEKSKAEWEEIRKNMQKTDERLSKVSENIGGLGNSLGELIETLIAAKLWEKFEGTPYKLQRAYRRVPIYDENNRTLTDVDILLSDTVYCMAVEVKREPDMEEVNRMIKRMERIRRYPPAEAKGKQLLGAMAGGFVPTEVRDYAHEQGFYVLELQGESVRLAPVPNEWTPRLWQ